MSHTFFQIEVSAAQRQYAAELVTHSIRHHTVPNIWDGKADHSARTYALRMTGSLGEVLFADTYQLERKTRAFGAADGQDWGKDFRWHIEEKANGNPNNHKNTPTPLALNVDIKSMGRDSGVFYGNYVLNIPASQLHKPESQTDCYFCISFHPKQEHSIASFIGYVLKNDILAQKIGIFYPADTVRKRTDGSTFRFYEDTYEIDFCDFCPPPITDHIRSLAGFRSVVLKSGKC